MPAVLRERKSPLMLRPGSGRYVLLALFWVLMAFLVIHDHLHQGRSRVIVDIMGPPVVNREMVGGWISTLPFRTFPFEDRSLLERVRSSHPWIRSLSEKKLPGIPRRIRVRFWTPVALLKPSYGLMAFESPSRRAVPSKVSYLNDQGLSLLGDPYEGSGALPMVIVRAPLTRTVGSRLVRTIRTVERCQRVGAPSGQWFSLNGPHEIRFYPGAGSPVILLGTDLGCAPFRLYQSFMKNHSIFSKGKLPEGIDLRFSGMLILRPVLDLNSTETDQKETGKLSGPY